MTDVHLPSVSGESEYKLFRESQSGNRSNLEMTHDDAAIAKSLDHLSLNTRSDDLNATVYDIAKQRAIEDLDGVIVGVSDMQEFLAQLETKCGLYKEANGNMTTAVSFLHFQEVLAASKCEAIRKLFTCSFIDRMRRRLRGCRSWRGRFELGDIAMVMNVHRMKMLQVKLVHTHARDSYRMGHSEFTNYINEEFMPKITGNNQFAQRYAHLYVTLVVETVFFHLDPLRSGYISTMKLLASPFFEWLLIAAEECRTSTDEDDFEFSNNWFSLKNHWSIVNQFRSLDVSETGMLTKKELLSPIFNEGALTPLFLSQVYDNGRFHNSDFDYTAFVLLTLALHFKMEDCTVRYLFNRLDLNGDGVLDAAELTALIDSMMVKYNVRIGVTVATSDVLNDVIDMINPACLRTSADGEIRITIEDVLSCGKGSTALFMLADCREFYKYEMKEQLDPEPNETEI